MSGNKDSDGGWKNFVWNSEKKEFLGRTGGSWFKILLFYLIFYGCLAGIFVGTIQALLLTLSKDKPTYQDRVAPPGKHILFLLTFLTLLLHQLSDQTKSLLVFRGRYRRLFGRGNCLFKEKRCCKLQWRNFSFPSIRSLTAPSNNSLLEELPVKVSPNEIPIYCKPKRAEDEGQIGEIKYYGIGQGFPLQYYPYYGKQLHPDYLQPLVAVQFVNVTEGKEIRIECKAFGDNIDYSEKDRYQGRFDIKLTVS
uniref:ATPase Na+/K+ transporting subunit beta 1a n=1 Tax=Haplochromis burtoni TaxID=8153 RepID=A0A3Q2VJH4_HAPBU